MGGEVQRSSFTYFSGYSTTEQCTGDTLSYLKPISGSLHVPIGGAYRTGEKIEGRVAIGEKTVQRHVENAVRTYLERIRNRLHEPIEGLFARLKKIESRSRIGWKTGQNHDEYYMKGAIDKNRTTVQL